MAKELVSEAVLSQEAAETPDRTWDFFILFGAFFLIVTAVHLNHMLLAGDWSFWTDWKDRQWWPVIGPVAAIIIPSALHYITWSQLQLPVGAVLGMVALLFGEWISRVFNFHMWDQFPLSYVWPETFIPAAIFLDLVLMWTRSYVVTSIFGALIWGLLFWPQNYPMMAAYLQPVLYNNSLMTVADLQGMMYVKTQTPEYLRIIEMGRLRAFLEEITVVVGAFAGFASMFTYWFPGQVIGRFIAVWPAKIFMKST